MWTRAMASAGGSSASAASASDVMGLDDVVHVDDPDDHNLHVESDDLVTETWALFFFWMDRINGFEDKMFNSIWEEADKNMKTLQ